MEKTFQAFYPMFYRVVSSTHLFLTRYRRGISESGDFKLITACIYGPIILYVATVGVRIGHSF